ncbi:MAG: DUF4390 domain-containing protein [Deltaproteobacteria bacterium]|nr:DUF4390 domain-containing protein [Deltaproteobacteria bacterium]
MRTVSPSPLSPNPAAPGSFRLPGSLLCLGLVLLFGAKVEAKPVVTKTADFVQHGGTVLMSAGFREMFDARLRRRLRSGFATTVTMRVYLYQRTIRRPVLALSRRLSAVYDLWDEQFLVRFDGPLGPRAQRFRSINDVVDRLTSFWRFPLVSTSRIKSGKRYYVAVVVEVNPMSRKVLAAVRRWLRKPTRRQVGGESLFGSFVSIFVNDEIRRAEKTFKFRTQDFFLP